MSSINLSNVLPSLLLLAATVSAHGQITTPTPRKPGTAMGTACGQQVLSNQASDSFGNIQGELQIAKSQSDFKADACHVWLCKGYQFADVPAANVQSYTAGQVVPITVEIRAPHTGTANVSVVDTKTNSIIGSMLKTFEDYASNSHTIPADNKQFDITMPDLGSKCAVAGDCVLQWWWDARSVDQTYASCVDFTMAGSGAGAGAGAGTGSGSDTGSASSASSAASTSKTKASVATSKAAVQLSTTTAKATGSVPTTLKTVVATPTAATPTSVAETPAATPSSEAVSAIPANTKLIDLLTWASDMVKSMVTA